MATPSPPPEATNDIDEGVLIGSAIGVAIVFLVALYMLCRVTYFPREGSWWKKKTRVVMTVRVFCWMLLFVVFPLSYALWIDHYDNVGNSHSDRQEIVYWAWVGLASAVAFTCCVGFLQDCSADRKSRARPGQTKPNGKPAASYTRTDGVPPPPQPPTQTPTQTRTQTRTNETALAREYRRPPPDQSFGSILTPEEAASDLASAAPLLAMPLVPPASP